MTIMKFNYYLPALALCAALYISAGEIPAGTQTHKPQVVLSKAKNKAIVPGALWYDESGNLINAHGGGILYDKGTYYWFGEKRGLHKSEGVNVYSSKDLYNWK